MFQRLHEAAGAELRFTIDGEPARGRAGDSVAAALLLNGKRAFRTTNVKNVPRGPFCMMGTCHDCYVEIDGTGNQQACRVLLRDGMAVATQMGKREPGR
jgi:predicted molibdopterin-dependent oxidoreductase YjgC